MSSSKRSTIIVEQLRKQQMLEALLRGKRLDGRNFDSYRDLEIEIGMVVIGGGIKSPVFTTLSSCTTKTGNLHVNRAATTA